MQATGNPVSTLLARLRQALSDPDDRADQTDRAVQAAGPEPATPADFRVADRPTFERRLHETLMTRGLAAAVSQTAGTFVCNHVFYSLMHALARKRGMVRGGFIHLPTQPELAKPGQPSLPLSAMRDAVALAIAIAAVRRAELKVSGGAES